MRSKLGDERSEGKERKLWTATELVRPLNIHPIKC